MGGLRPSLTDASGGLTYHWRALRYRGNLWKPFCAQVERWLLDWQPPQEKLLIVGPSAGYSLPARFLSRFAQVTILEPDPLARQLLARRFPALDFVYGSLDCMGSAEAPASLAAEYPDSAILFSNVIGQCLDGLPRTWASALQIALAGHSWASYHDVISTEVPPRAVDLRRFSVGVSLEEVLMGFWDGGEIFLHDHQTFAALPVEDYAIWQILPSRYHLIGWRCQCVAC